MSTTMMDSRAALAPCDTLSTPPPVADRATAQVSPMVNHLIKLPAVVQRGDAVRKQQSGAPLRRLLGSKRLHYSALLTASTPSRSPAPQLTPDRRHGSASSVSSVKTSTASLKLVRVRASVVVRCAGQPKPPGRIAQWRTRAATLLS